MTESSVTEYVYTLRDIEGKQMFRSGLSSTQMYCFLTIIEELFDTVQLGIPSSVCTVVVL